jgi:hypothetical protein
VKKYKSPGIDQIPAELIQDGGEILRSDIPTHAHFPPSQSVRASRCDHTESAVILMIRYYP